MSAPSVPRPRGATAPLRRRPSRRHRLLLVGVLAVAILIVAMSALKGTLTYYRTPTELKQQGPTGQQVRLSGLVEPGTVRQNGGGVTFVITDGATNLTVDSTAEPPDTFRAGQGALVIGRLQSTNVFRATEVVVRHSNQYRAASPSDRRTP